MKNLNKNLLLFAIICFCSIYILNNLAYGAFLNNCPYENTHPLIHRVYSHCFQDGYPPCNVYDGDLTTCYVVHPYLSCTPRKVYLDMRLRKSVKALEVKITASISGITVSPGNTLNYHTTLMNNETFYIIKPDAFSRIIFEKQQEWGNVYEIEITELDINTISLPFAYDDAGNMTQRTIVLGNSLKSSPAMASAIPYEINDELPEEEEIFEFDAFTVYPNPTRGELRIETNHTSTETTESMISVYSMQGSLLINKPFTAPSAIINLADQPSGMYILILTLNGNIHRWNIIKE